MANPSQKLEEEYGPSDPTAGAGDTTPNRPLDEDEKAYIYILDGPSPSHDGSKSGWESVSNGQEKTLAMDRSKSYATTTSAITRTDSHVDVPIVKPWYKKLNPLRWGKTPPVPKQRGVSREYTASFLSLVYFQWVAPLMAVSFPPLPHVLLKDSSSLTLIGWVQTAIGAK